MLIQNCLKIFDWS